MSKDDKLTYLYDEIGTISDRFVNEALVLERKKSSMKLFIKTLAVAAVVIIIVVIGLFAIAGMALGSVWSDMQTESITSTTTIKDDKPPVHSPSDKEDVKELKELIKGIDSENVEQLAFQDIKNDLLFDGNVRFIWTYGNLVYYSVTVENPRDIIAVEDYLASENHRIKSQDPINDDFRFWVSFGNGITTSPFLENNAGGESFGELSDYVPEVYPSDEFAEFIAELIEGR